MKQKISIVISALLIMLSFQSTASEALSADAIKALIVGKTVQAENIRKGFKFKVYFTADGKVTREWKGDMQEGTYSFDGNKHCINVGGGDKCGTIVANGDGTYKRLKNGRKHVINWLSFTEGKHF